MRQHDWSVTVTWRSSSQSRLSGRPRAGSLPTTPVPHLPSAGRRYWGHSSWTGVDGRCWSMVRRRCQLTWPAPPSLAGSAGSCYLAQRHTAPPYPLQDFKALYKCCIIIIIIIIWPPLITQLTTSYWFSVFRHPFNGQNLGRPAPERLNQSGF